MDIKFICIVLILIAVLLPKLFDILMVVFLGRDWLKNDLSRLSTPKAVLMFVFSLLFLWVEGSVMIIVPAILLAYKLAGDTGIYAMFACVMDNFWYIVPLFSILAVGFGFYIFYQFSEH